MKKELSPKYQPWIDAREKFHLSHAIIQMARELGMNPQKFGKLANHKQEPWKLPLPQFIAELYRKRFGKDRPDDVRPLEVILAERKQKKAEKKIQKRQVEAGQQVIPTNQGDPGDILPVPDNLDNDLPF